ncbi:MAG: tRNA 2-thiouridine(34) synthase MnmA [Bacillota bacterium]|nr:tRNA 2-thiouridine(34) synthase MnmA [Bacillota bacterium]
MQNITMIAKKMKRQAARAAEMDSKSDRNKVILGLSGGVDSTAAALILQKQGYEVIGLYFNVLSDFCMNCDKNVAEGRKKAERAAQQLGIELVYRDMSADFDKIVVDNFCSEYMSGRTPNPCIICNPEIKFRALVEAADELGAYHIATGHYAGTYYDAKADKWFIRKSANEAKDQSYMLYRLTQEQISRLVLPLEGYSDKEEIRTLARSAGVDNAEDKDSQEICFVDKDDTYLDFLSRKGCKAPEGPFLDAEGRVLGTHKGICSYTIGQRKGLGIALGRPAFVTEIDADRNAVILGENEDLFSNVVESTGNILCKQINNVQAKIRYAAKPADAVLSFDDEGNVKVVFAEAQRAATPGQSIVFYDGDLVIGGGFIR